MEVFVKSAGENCTFPLTPYFFNSICVCGSSACACVVEKGGMRWGFSDGNKNPGLGMGSSTKELQ